MPSTKGDYKEEASRDKNTNGWENTMSSKGKKKTPQKRLKTLKRCRRFVTVIEVLFGIVLVLFATVLSGHEDGINQNYGIYKCRKNNYRMVWKCSV